jgi:hypothetical protein
VSNNPMTWRKASALVPLAVLSSGWTAALAVTSDGAQSAAPSETRVALPPPRPIYAPASLSRGGKFTPAGSAASTMRTLSAGSTTSSIPAVARAAYERAATVIDSADTTCHLAWPLVAAIGRVESDHGRYGGNLLNADGVATPGIYGVPLTGAHGTQRVLDTDAGQYDHDQRFDRAVGPMQFIPSTWSLVEVDADGDSKRNPQDIDDAALGAAVYLCSGNEDLASDSGVNAAVYRYNHSTGYVALVKSIARAYATGSYASVPYAPTPVMAPSPVHAGSVFAVGSSQHTQHDGGASSSTGGSTPAAPASDGPAAGQEESQQPADQHTTQADPVTAVTATTSGALSALQKATAYCEQNLTSSQLDALGGLTRCTNAYLDGGSQAVTDLLAALRLGSLLGSLLPGTS